MPMRGIDDEDVDPGLAQRVGTIPSICEEADGGTDEEPTVRGLAGQRVLLGLHEVLDGDEAAQVALVVDDRQALALVRPEQRRCVFAADAERAGDERHRRHDLADRAGAPLRDGHEPQVAVGDDAEQLVVLVDDGEAGDAVLTAGLVELLEGGLGVDGDGVGNHAGLGALDEVDLVRLVLDREVAVQDADAALARHRDGHARLGDRVHGAGEQRDAQVEVAGESRRGVDLARDDVGFAREQEDVVVGEPQGGELVRDARLLHAPMLPAVLDAPRTRGCVGRHSGPRAASSPRMAVTRRSVSGVPFGASRIGHQVCGSAMIASISGRLRRP